MHRWHQAVPWKKRKRTGLICCRPSLLWELDSVQQWITDWQIDLAVDKCITKHFRKKTLLLHNPCTTPILWYLLENVIWASLSRVICIGQTTFLRLSKKARGVLAALSHHYPDIYLQLYMITVCLHLEFASAIWNPYLTSCNLFRKMHPNEDPPSGVCYTVNVLLSWAGTH